MKNPSPPAPEHSFEKSRIVEPARHEKTGRTVGRIQDDANGTDSHLFSATGLYIATVATSTLPAKWKKRPVAAPVAPAAADGATPPTS